MILTSQDCLDVGICRTGQVRFCRQHKIDFRQFLKDGISVEALTHIEDFNLSRAVSRAEQRVQGAS